MIKSFRFMFSLMRPFLWFLIGQVLVAIIWAFNLTAQPYLIKIILNTISQSTAEDVASSIWMPCALSIAMSLVYVLSLRFYDWIMVRREPELKKHISMTLMDRLMDHSHGLYQNTFSGSLANNVQTLMESISSIRNVTIDQFFANTLALCIAIYTVWCTDIKFAWGLLTLTSLFFAISLATFSKSQWLSDQVSEAKSTVMGHIVDILSNIMNVRLFCNKPSEKIHLQRSFEKTIEIERTRGYFFLKIRSLQGFFFVIFQGICFFWLVSGLQTQTITPGDFALILTINFEVVKILSDMAKDIRQFTKDLGQITQGLRIVLSPLEIQNHPDAKPLTVERGAITFERVMFQYPETEPLFENKSVNVLPAQKIGLVGYSGSGKSTFANLILRLFDVSSGRILIDDVDIRKVTQESLRQAIAVIPQDPCLFHRTLMENIRYGKVDATDDEVMEAAAHAAAHDFIISLPQGYNSVVGDRGIKLSGGQRQRIAIARAFLKNSPILILDEATSQLDSVTEKHIQESLWRLMEQKTTLVIAHRLSTLLHMDRILVFEQGNIVEDGNHEELLQKEGLYKTLWNAQVGGWLTGT
jgi:ATP-binding cassette subfamily B protein